MSRITTIAIVMAALSLPACIVDASAISAVTCGYRVPRLANSQPAAGECMLVERMSGNVAVFAWPAGYTPGPCDVTDADRVVVTSNERAWIAAPKPGGTTSDHRYTILTECP
jgi:hypothetical protein